MKVFLFVVITIWFKQAVKAQKRHAKPEKDDKEINEHEKNEDRRWKERMELEDKGKKNVSTH